MTEILNLPNSKMQEVKEFQFLGINPPFPLNEHILFVPHAHCDISQ